MIADDLLDIASHLTEGNLTQTHLRRAVSNIYYAVFHTIAQSNADTLVGDATQLRDQIAWRQAYRALEHGYGARRCQSAQSSSQFSEPIKTLAAHFVDMQSRRHRADYDPDETFTPQDVVAIISETIAYISAFRAAPEPERRAFAVYVLMRDRQD